MVCMMEVFDSGINIIDGCFDVFKYKIHKKILKSYVVSTFNKIHSP